MEAQKDGIIYDYHKEDALDVLKRYLKAMKPYIESGVGIGADLGTRAEDIRRIRQELGVKESAPKSIRENPKKVEEGNKRLQEIMSHKVDGLDMDRLVTGYGVAAAADEAWKLLEGNPVLK